MLESQQKRNQGDQYCKTRAWLNRRDQIRIIFILEAGSTRSAEAQKLKNFMAYEFFLSAQLYSVRGTEGLHRFHNTERARKKDCGTEGDSLFFLSRGGRSHQAGHAGDEVTDKPFLRRIQLHVGDGSTYKSKRARRFLPNLVVAMDRGATYMVVKSHPSSANEDDKKERGGSRRRAN